MRLPYVEKAESALRGDDIGSMIDLAHDFPRKVEPPLLLPVSGAHGTGALFFEVVVKIVGLPSLLTHCSTSSIENEQR